MDRIEPDFDPTQGAVVKSAGRAFEVLELFRRNRRQMNAADIGTALGYPKSSTNALLKSLVTLGYLHLNHRTLQYFPSLNVTRLGDWIPAAVSASGVIMTVLAEVHAATQETVTLSVLNDLSANFLKVLPGTFPISLTMTEGFSAPLFTSAVGTALMSSMTDDEIAALATTQAARSRSRGDRVELAKVMAGVQETREKGYCVVSDAVLPDTAAIAFPFPSEMEGFPVAIGVGGLRDRILRNEKFIAKTVRSSMTRHLVQRSRGTTRVRS